MALFEVTLRQAYDNKNVINRWNYASSGVPAAVSLSFALASAFGGIPDPITGEFPDDSLMAFLAGMQNTGLRYVELQVENMYDVVDFYTIPYASSQAGLTGGERMSAFVAYGFTSNRLRTDVRRGSKRFAGASETYVGEYGVITSSGMETLEGVAEALSATLTYDDEGTDIEFRPTVLSYQKHDPDVDHEREWYSKYATLAAQMDHAAVGVKYTANPNATTQNTRKK